MELLILVLTPTILTIVALSFLHGRLATYYPLPPFPELVLVLFSRGPLSEEPNYALFVRRLRRGLLGCKSRSVNGSDRAAAELTVYAAPEDLREASSYLTDLELACDIARAYRQIAGRKGWSGITDAVTVSFVEDPSRRLNFPHVTPARAPHGVVPFVVDLAELSGEPIVASSQGVLDPTVPLVSSGFDETERHLWDQLAEAELWMDSPTAPMFREPALRLGPNLACTLNPDGTTVGRNRSSALVVPDPTVSRSHATILRSGVEWVLSPHSGHKCIVNGMPTSSQTVLRSGDRISFAQSTDIYVVELPEVVIL